MGKLVVTEFITLDGVVQDPGGAERDTFDRGGWAFRTDRGDEGTAFKVEELLASDAQLLGRVTYEGFAKAWPAMNDDQFGQRMNSMPKFVVSSTLETADWTNSTILLGDVAEEVGKLKAQFGGDILVAGSISLVQSLLALDLVDRLNLMVYPVLLGTGKRLFAEGAELPLTLTGSRQSAQVAILTFDRQA